MKKKIHLSILMLLLVLSLMGCESSSIDSSLDVQKNESSLNYTDNVTGGVSISSSGMVGFKSESNNEYSQSEDIQEIVDEMKEDVGTEEENEGTEEESHSQNSSNNNNIVLVDEKLVYKCYVEIETLDFDKSYTELQDMMTKYNCVIASEEFTDESISYLYDGYNYRYDNYQSGRIDDIVIRVPSVNYKEFISEYGELGNITSKTQTVDNITQEYYDTTSQVDGLNAEMERLESMLAQATEINDMISLNKAITNLQSEINSLTTYIRTMDSDVAYSYVTLTLKEVLEYSEVEEPVKTNTFLDRLKNQCVNTWEGFLDFLEDLLFAIIALIPAIVIIGIIIIIIRITCKNKIKAWKENRKIRKAFGCNSINELDTLLKYDENKTTSEVDKDESNNNQ